MLGRDGRDGLTWISTGRAPPATLARIHFIPGANAMIRNRRARRVTGALLLAAGALLMWLAPESLFGVALLAGGIALEAIGLHFERRPAPEDDRHAVER
jgi:hypothetical protein